MSTHSVVKAFTIANQSTSPVNARHAGEIILLESGETKVFSDPGAYKVTEVDAKDKIFYIVTFNDGSLEIAPGNAGDSRFKVSAQLV
jgi:hypothetical protein